MGRVLKHLEFISGSQRYWAIIVSNVQDFIVISLILLELLHPLMKVLCGTNFCCSEFVKVLNASWSKELWRN